MEITFIKFKLSTAQHTVANPKLKILLQLHFIIGIWSDNTFAFSVDAKKMSPRQKENIPEDFWVRLTKLKNNDMTKICEWSKKQLHSIISIICIGQLFSL